MIQGHSREHSIEKSDDGCVNFCPLQVPYFKLGIFLSMSWRQYQEQSARFFRSLGCAAEIDAKIQGARATHQIDVWVRFKKFGLETKWVVECKHWNSAVPKEKVLALKSIVEDISTDRGILIATRGFQVGAIRASEKTNITLTDLEGLKEIAQEELVSSLLHGIETRTLQVKYALHDLFAIEQTGPSSLMSRPHPGVDGNAVHNAIGKLVMLEYGFERIRLKSAPYPVKYDDTGQRQVTANTLEEFVAQASDVIGEAEMTLQVQLASKAT